MFHVEKPLFHEGMPFSLCFSYILNLRKLKEEYSLGRTALKLRSKYGEGYEMVSKKERKKGSPEI